MSDPTLTPRVSANQPPFGPVTDSQAVYLTKNYCECGDPASCPIHAYAFGHFAWNTSCNALTKTTPGPRGLFLCSCPPKLASEMPTGNPHA